MRIAFFSTKPYDRIWFEPMGKDYGYDMHFIEAPFNEETVTLAKGHDAVCIFVNDSVTAGMIDQMCDMGIKALLLRSAGFNHVDIHAAKGRIPVLRVPSYSPEAVAEYAMAMLLTVNRYTHKAYNRTRDFNMNINGFIGTDLNHKVAGVVGTGKIGQAMIRIFKGFNMQVLAYDPLRESGRADGEGGFHFPALPADGEHTLHHQPGYHRPDEGRRLPGQHLQRCTCGYRSVDRRPEKREIRRRGVGRV